MKVIDKIIVKIGSSFLVPAKLRPRILNKRIGCVSSEVYALRSGIYFFGNRINISDGVFVNKFCRLFSGNKPGSEIIIGRNVVIAMGVTMTTHTHEIASAERRASYETLYRPIVIEDGCWIGANVTILPGVTIKKGTVVAAGSVVTADLEANSLYGGVPAKLIKTL